MLAGAKRRASATLQPILNTSSSEVAMTLRSLLSSSPVPATSGNMLFTTACEKAKMTRPTIATAA